MINSFKGCCPAIRPRGRQKVVFDQFAMQNQSEAVLIVTNVRQNLEPKVLTQASCASMKGWIYHQAPIF